MGKVELLSPAGNFSALKGAINAGADAVYLGGEHYGARAYAENFTQDELCAGIHFVHVFGKRVYLAVNTLVKEKELDGLYDFLLPLYEEGLDGVIVQDLGVLCYIREHFPGLALHASTQMTLTGSGGATFVKKEGVSRIVPARELSLEEIRKIKTETGVEVETFIHGAMCYCYSGQCLLSSMLGGRSGNRGRCAQPCRLPYKAPEMQKGYPLSMKDMCAIDLLPKLIEAGIDSFKIEGRMKKPAYAAGVTAIYRKYIDLYYEDKEHYFVLKEDRKLLNSLYIRSEIGEGYYRRHNGKEMISLHSPAYSETDAGLLADIENRYINREMGISTWAKVYLSPNQKARLLLRTDQIQVERSGETTQKAVKQPLTREKTKEQIQKSGNSLLKITDVDVALEDSVFLPVRSLNELRRSTVAAMENEIIRQNGLDYRDRKAVFPKKPGQMKHLAVTDRALGKKEFHTGDLHGKELHVYVRTCGQLKAACGEPLTRVYLDYALLEGANQREIFSCLETGRKNGQAFFLAAPYIVREKGKKYLERIKKALLTEGFEGVLVRNLESYQFFGRENFAGKIVLDAGFYIWNRETLKFWDGRAGEFYLPLECNAHEWKELLLACQERSMRSSAIVYGRLPMMIAANCIRKTMEKCSRVPEITVLKDRYEKQFPVYTDCLCCYNILYNSVPLSLHGMFKGGAHPAENFRLDFTLEGEEETRQVIRYFHDIFKSYREPFYNEYTTGHYKRGVE